jgi:hypothetical protein
LNPLKINFFDEIENANKNKTAINNPNTPPNLLGIERRIAYAKRKYHSG